MPKDIATEYVRQNTSSVRARRFAQAGDWDGLVDHQHRHWADTIDVWNGHEFQPAITTRSGTFGTANEDADGDRDLDAVHISGCCRREIDGEQARLAWVAVGSNVKVRAEFINTESDTTLATRTLDFTSSSTVLKRDEFTVPWADIASHVDLVAEYGNGREGTELIRVKLTFRQSNTTGAPGGLSAVWGGEAKVTDSADLITSGSQIWTPYDLTSTYGGTWLNIRNLGRVYQDSGGTTSADANGDPVGLVEDPFGQANWGQTDSGERPLLDTDQTLGGHPTLQFRDRTSREYLFAPVGGSSSDYTFFCLVRLDAWNGGVRESWMQWNNAQNESAPINLGKGSSDKYGHWRGPAAGRVFTGADFSGKGYMTGSPDLLNPDNIWAMTTIRQTRTSASNVDVDIWLEHNKTTVSGDWEDWFDEVAVGGSLSLESNERPFQGNIAEALCFFGSLTDAEIKRVWNYWEWIFFNGAPPT